MGKSNKDRRPDPFEDEQPPGYHYSRQERLSLPTAPRLVAKGGGVFRRNRTLLIILVDLVIVAILGLFLMRYLYAQVNRAEVEGYTVVLRGARAREVVMATLSVASDRAAPETEQRIYVRFSTVRNPGAEDSTYISGSAPRAGEQETILRAAIPASGSPKVLYAEVQIGGALKRLSTGLGP